MKLFPKQQFERSIERVFGIGLSESLNYLNLRRAESGLESFLDFDKKLKLDRTHELVLACIAKTSGERIHHILEFGTYSGETTKVLRALFPHATISTIDLPNPELTAEDTEAFTNFIREKRNESVVAANANLILKDSITLEQSDFENYDLIWIDGDHTIPVIAMDMINSIRAINKNGYILVDDVCTNISITNLLMRKYVSTDTWRVLKALSSSFNLDYDLFPKKLNWRQLLPGRRRYFSLIQRKSDH